MLLRQDHHRVGKRVVKKTLANITDWPDHVVEGLRVLPKRGALDDSGQGCRITGSPPHGHVAAVPGTLRKPGLDRLIACRPSPQPQCIVAMNCARAIDPRSKLAAVRKKKARAHIFLRDSLGSAGGIPYEEAQRPFFPCKLSRERRCYDQAIIAPLKHDNSDFYRGAGSTMRLVKLPSSIVTPSLRSMRLPDLRLMLHPGKNWSFRMISTW